MFEHFLTIFQVLGKTLGILKSVFMIIFISFLAYIQFNTNANLIQYDGVPCQNTIFSLGKPMEQVIGGESTMRKGYYHITKNLLQDINEDYQTVKRTGQIYPEESRFKVISYYVAFDSGPLSGLGGGPTPKYLLQSLDTSDYMWIAYFKFDSKLCQISNNVNDTNFDIAKHEFDLNITKTTIKL